MAVTVLLATATSIDAQAPRTVQDGVFSNAQASRGQALYTQRCAGCHGAALTGGQAPPLEGAEFRFKWRKELLSALFIKIRYTMPPNAADEAKLTPEQGADLVAHVLKSNGFPAGTADFPAADATASTIGWPPAPAGERPSTTAARYVPAATLNQLMRGVFFPNSNLIFTVQELEPEKLPPQPPSSKPGGLTIFEWGQQIYTGWPVVENAAASLADASTLMLVPGLRCENGRLAPVAEPDWIRFTDEMIAIAKRTYRLAQTRNQEAVSAFTEDLSNACNACHRTYRDVGGRGRGANVAGGANAPTGPNSARCTHR
ncbi:MAG TPA: cytochrome c [Vicinamibacterales bacterium]|nr:cytochrome c [Vicinamibacterales bacterium]